MNKKELRKLTKPQEGIISSLFGGFIELLDHANEGHTTNVERLMAAEKKNQPEIHQHIHLYAETGEKIKEIVQKKKVSVKEYKKKYAEATSEQD